MLRAMLEQSDHVTERPWLRLETLRQYSGDLDLTLTPKDLDYFSAYGDLPQTPGASGNLTLTSAGASEPLSERAALKTTSSAAQDFASAASCEPDAARSNLAEMTTSPSSFPTLQADSAASATAEKWTSTWLALQARHRPTMAARFDMAPSAARDVATTSTATAATYSGSAYNSASNTTSSTASLAADLKGTPHLSEDGAYQRFATARRVSSSAAKPLELPAMTREDAVSMTTALGYESLSGRTGRGQYQSRDSGYSLSPLSGEASPSQPAFRSWSPLDGTEDLTQSAACAAATGEYSLFPADKNLGAIGSERKRSLPLPGAPEGASASPSLEAFPYPPALPCDLNLPDEGFATLTPRRPSLLNPRQSSADLLESLDSRSPGALPASPSLASPSLASRASQGAKLWEAASEWTSPGQDGGAKVRSSSASSAFHQAAPLTDPGPFYMDQPGGSLARERSASMASLPLVSAASGERNYGSFSNGLGPVTSSAMLGSSWNLPHVGAGSLASGNLESLSPGPYLPRGPQVSLAALHHPMAPAMSCATRAVYPGGPFLTEPSHRLLVRGAPARRHGVSEFPLGQGEGAPPLGPVPVRLVPHPFQLPLLPSHPLSGLPLGARLPHPFAVGSVLVPPRAPNAVPVLLADPWSLGGCGPLDVSARLPSFHELHSFASPDGARGLFRGARYPPDPSRPFSRRSHGDVFGATMDIVNRRLNQHVSVRRNVEINFTFQVRGEEEGLAPRFRLLPVQWQLHMVGLRERVTFKLYAIPEPPRQKSRSCSASSTSLAELCREDSADSKTSGSVYGASPLLGTASEAHHLNGSSGTNGDESVSKSENGFLTAESNAAPQDCDALPSLQNLHKTGRLKVDIITPSGRTFEPKVSTDSETEAYFSYEFENFGKYVIRATIDGENVKGSEWVMHCHEAKDYSNLLEEEGKYVEVLSLRSLPRDIKLHGVTYHPRRGLLLPDRSHAHVHVYDVEDSLARPSHRGVLVQGDPEGLDPHSVVQPSDVAVGPDGLVFVCDKKGNRVQVYDKDKEFLASYIGLETSWGVACSASNRMAVATFSKNDGELHVLDCDSQTRNILRLPGNNPRKPFFLPDGRLALLDFEKTRLVLAEDREASGLPLSLVCDFGVRGKPVGAAIDAFGNVIVSTGRTCRLEFLRCVSDGVKEEWVNYLSLDFKPRLPRGTSFGGVAVLPGGRLVVVLESHEHEVEHRLLLLNPPAERKYKR